MLRAIVFSLVALITLVLGVRAFDTTPEQAREQIMLAEINAQEGAEFRRTNRLRAGVIELDSGVQVEVLHQGEGRLPSTENWVEVHYTGRHADGRIFDDSRRRGEPMLAPLEKTIAGWRDVLRHLPVGSRAVLVIPPDMAYGRVGSGPVGPEETLIFELELLDIHAAPEPFERGADQQRVLSLRST